MVIIIDGHAQWVRPSWAAAALGGAATRLLPPHVKSVQPFAQQGMRMYVLTRAEALASGFWLYFRLGLHH